MKKSLPLIFLLVFTLTLHGQKDSTNFTRTLAQRNISKDQSGFNIRIYPVPDKDISFVKITNIIGQDIFRFQYNDPQQLVKIVLEKPKRGMYLVTILFSDGNRVVKKIMVEE